MRVNSRSCSAVRLASSCAEVRRLARVVLEVVELPVALDICPYRHIMRSMARAATTADAFNAVAEPRRRQILDLLSGGERPVNDLVRALGVAQPQVSKHLRVLREVGAVDVRGAGRQRLYRLNGHALKPIHDWVKEYERSWSERFDRLDAVLEELKQEEEDDDSGN